MTRRDGDPGREEDPDGPGDAERPRGFIRSLLAILQEMEERGERTRSGHSRPGPHTSVDYSISVGGLSGPGEADPFGTGREDSGSRGSRSDEQTPDAHVTTRETPEGVVVAADLPGVDGAEVDTYVDPDAGVLVIEVAERVAARLPLQSDGWSIADSRFENGVLEVELHRG